MVTTRHHLTRRDMKDDEFVSWVTRATLWAEENARTVVYVIGGVLALVIAVIGAIAWQRSRTESAYVLLGEVQRVARTPLQGETGADASSPGSAAERAQRVVAAADTMLAQYGGGMPAAWARYQRAEALLSLGRRDEAASDLESVIGAAGGDSLLAGLARVLAGHVEEDRGNLQRAADLYAEAAETAGPSFPPEVALAERARCLVKMGNTQEAIDTYQKIVDVYSESPLAASAGEKLRALRAASSGL